MTGLVGGSTSEQQTPLATNPRRTVAEAVRHYEAGYPQECDGDLLTILKGQLSRIVQVVDNV